MDGSDVDLTAVVAPGVESGVPHGASLTTFAEAVLGTDDTALAAARRQVLAELGPAGLVDAAAVVATFMQMDRIADGTGIPLDPALVKSTQEMRSRLGFNDFASARNTLSEAT